MVSFPLLYPELSNSNLRVDSRVSSPPLSFLCSGGLAGRCGDGVGGRDTSVHSRSRVRGRLLGRYAFPWLHAVDAEGRTTDLGGQIRRAMIFFLLAALRWWQASMHAKWMEVRIPPNKVRSGLFFVFWLICFGGQSSGRREDLPASIFRVDWRILVSRAVVGS